MFNIELFIINDYLASMTIKVLKTKLYEHSFLFLVRKRRDIGFIADKI